MKTHALVLLIGLLLGVAGCYWFLSSRTVSLPEFRALQEAHVKAVALGADLRAERDAHRAASKDAENTAASLRRLRPETRTQILSNPDSAATKAGIVATAPDSATRCIPVADFARLLADRADLHLSDSAARWDNVALSACKQALAFSDSAEAVAREDAGRLHGAAHDLAGEVQASRRARWLWAAGGAALAFLTVFGAGAL